MPNYQPLSPKEIERGYYFLTHRQQLIRLAYLAVGLVVAIIYTILIYNLVILFHYPSWQQAASGFVRPSAWPELHRQNQPQNLNIGLPKALAIGNNIYNLVVVVKNPNKDWLLPAFDYNFVVNGEALETKVSYLNTEDTVVLSSLGYRSSQNIKDLKINISNYHWQNLSAEIKPIKWAINNIKFQPLRRETVNDQSLNLPATATWQAKNLSLYDFWQVDWQVLLLNGDNMVGFAEVPARDFKSLELRDLQAVFNYNLGNVSRVEIIPRVNWLDRDNFKLIESDSTNPGL